MCVAMTADVRHYRVHEQLIADNSELNDRSERTLLQLAEAMATALQAQEATLAAHLALACYRPGWATAGLDPEGLKPEVDEAFRLVLRKTWWARPATGYGECRGRRDGCGVRRAEAAGP